VSGWLDKVASIISQLDPDDDLLALLNEIEGIEVGQSAGDLNDRLASDAYATTRELEFDGDPGQLLTRQRG
jgi:hypothetical protein